MHRFWNMELHGHNWVENPPHFNCWWLVSFEHYLVIVAFRKWMFWRGCWSSQDIFDFNDIEACFTFKFYQSDVLPCVLQWIDFYLLRYLHLTKVLVQMATRKTTYEYNSSHEVKTLGSKKGLIDHWTSSDERTKNCVWFWNKKKSLIFTHLGCHYHNVNSITTLIFFVIWSQQLLKDITVCNNLIAICIYFTTQGVDARF